ncbi:hypothetical protein FHX48_002613 [Microbacterium halimionae]|uniref:Zinc-binding dehydrogenase n=1 Tax=Microbacterium halimionae TaxID=1526413 RepID=A0A7W3JRB6_9MICO|nr:hypothetical protein [Microbacterium halimionae]MBA8817508.1 hypothetical protein [Microbacterium halimionae]NII95049.1 hypothetical protein [Microbacterium halimionae]
MARDEDLLTMLFRTTGEGTQLAFIRWRRRRRRSRSRPTRQTRAGSGGRGVGPETYPLANIADAHRAFSGRGVRGKIVIVDAL